MMVCGGGGGGVGGGGSGYNCVYIPTIFSMYKRKRYNR